MKDYYGKDASRLKNKKLWLFDMDGTIYEENRIFDGTLDLLAKVKEMGGTYMFLTNNSSKGVQDYVKKVRKMGIEADENTFFTSVDATILYLSYHFPGKKIYCQGTKSLINNLKNAGISVTEEVEEDAEVVLVGFDTELTFEKLSKTCEMLRRPDIPFIATNPDFVCPVAGGFVPDCGSMCIGIEYATGRKPIYIGKPEPTMVNIVRDKLRTPSFETVLIGDRLYTDIASGHNAGVDTICVLSGEATEEDIKNYEIQPDFVFKSVKEIYGQLEE